MFDDLHNAVGLDNRVMHQPHAPSIAVLYAIAIDGIALLPLTNIDAIVQVDGVNLGILLDEAGSIAPLHDGYRFPTAATREGT